MVDRSRTQSEYITQFCPRCKKLRIACDCPLPRSKPRKTLLQHAETLATVVESFLTPHERNCASTKRQAQEALADFRAFTGQR